MTLVMFYMWEYKAKGYHCIVEFVPYERSEGLKAVIKKSRTIIYLSDKM